MGSGGGGGGNPGALAQSGTPMPGIPQSNGGGSNIDPFNYGYFQSFLPEIPAAGKGPAPSATGLTQEMFQYLSPQGQTPDQMKNTLAGLVNGTNSTRGIDVLPSRLPQTIGANGTPNGPAEMFNYGQGFQPSGGGASAPMQPMLQQPQTGGPMNFYSAPGAEAPAGGGGGGGDYSFLTAAPPTPQQGPTAPGSSTLFEAGPTTMAAPGQFPNWATMIGNPGMANPWAGHWNNKAPAGSEQLPWDWSPALPPQVTGGY